MAAVYTTRAEFSSAYAHGPLLGEATRIRAVGLSLNVICQQFPDQELRDKIEDGAEAQCLFLDPRGVRIAEREAEEGIPAGHLSTLTAINIDTLTRRVRDRLSPEAAPRLQIGTYDEVLRFNVLLVDDDLCIAQPYLPYTRGIDSPTLVVQRQGGTRGLFSIFESMFDGLWTRRRAL